MRKAAPFQGFTLVEILLVTGVLTILMGAILVIVKPAFLFGQARDSRRKNDLKQIQAALEQYKQDHNTYPATPGWQNSTGASPWLAGLDATYIKFLPIDPTNSGCSSSTALFMQEPTCFAYSYYSDGYCSMSGTDYILVTRMETNTANQSQLNYINPLTGATCNWPGGVSVYGLSAPGFN